MKRFLIGIILLFLFGHVYGQEKKALDFKLPVGLVFNISNSEFMNTNGLGLYFEPKFFYEDKFIFGYRFEPIALVSGVLELPGGCIEEQPSFSGISSCREGANYLLNNYLFTDYRIGDGKNEGLRQFYAGLSLNIYTHSRYIITSREPGNWKDKEARVTNVGPGVRFGGLLGKIQINLSYNLTGSQFQPYLGTSIGYHIIK